MRRSRQPPRRPPRPRRVEHRERHRLAGPLDLGDAAVGRIDLGEERSSGSPAASASCSSTTGAAPHRRRRCAARAALAGRERGSRRWRGAPSRRPRCAARRLDLAPGQLAVAVGVEIEGDVEVAQRDVPAHRERARAGRRAAGRRRSTCAPERRRRARPARAPAPMRRTALPAPHPRLRAAHRCAGRAGRATAFSRRASSIAAASPLAFAASASSSRSSGSRCCSTLPRASASACAGAASTNSANIACSRPCSFFASGRWLAWAMRSRISATSAGAVAAFARLPAIARRSSTASVRGSRFNVANASAGRPWAIRKSA